VSGEAAAHSALNPYGLFALEIEDHKFDICGMS
jgi:hypothetical protein